MDTGFREDTQVLTVNGWINIKDIEVGQKLISYHKKKDKLVYDEVIDTAKLDSKVINTYNKLTEFTCGKLQKWYGWKRMWAKKGQTRPKKFLEFDLLSTTQEFNILLSGVFDEDGSNEEVTAADGSFLGWITSDGYYKWSEYTGKTSQSKGNKLGLIGMIAQSQHKYWKDVEEAIDEVNLSYSKNVDLPNGEGSLPVNKYHFYAGELRPYFDRVLKERKNKHDTNWTEHVLSWKNEVREAFLYAFWLADGNTKGLTYCGNKMIITQNVGEIFDAVCALMFFKGRRISFSDKDEVGKCKSIRLLRNSHLTLQETKTTILTGKYACYDILTGNNTYVIRQGGFVGITCSSSFNLKETK
ncbi:hypothetical protein VP249E411_P0099 [Vibrio phage 249E41-1]|nr:hypothetical protein VP249E411_P0099 [Vibrio phage 249E41-1]